MGFCLWHSAASRAALPGLAGRRQRSIRQRHCPTVSHQSQNGDVMARPLCPAGFAEPMGDCSGSGAQSHLWLGENPTNHRHHPAIQTPRRNAVELPHLGQTLGAEQVHGEQTFAQTHFETASRENVQALPRSSFLREIDRRGRPVFESTRASDRVMRGRKEPNSSFRSYPARFAHEERALWNDDARLQAPRDDCTVRGARTGTRQSRGRVLPAAPTSRIPELSPPLRQRVSCSGSLTPGDGQLWHPQKGGGSDLAEKASSFRASFRTNQFELVELGRTLVL